MKFLQAKLERQGGKQTAVVDVDSEDLTKPHTVGELKSELLEFVNRVRPDLLIVDWSRVRRAGTDSFGIMLMVKRHLAEWNGQLRLCGMSPLLADGFTQCGLSRVIPIFRDTETARPGGAENE